MEIARARRALLRPPAYLRDAIRISCEIAGDATPQKLREIVEQSRARSAVYDVFANGVPVDVDVNVI